MARTATKKAPVTVEELPDGYGLEPDQIPQAFLVADPPDRLMESIDDLYDRIGRGTSDGGMSSGFIDTPKAFTVHRLGEHKLKLGTTEKRRKFPRLAESIVWDPKTQVTPVISPTTANSQMVALTLEDRLWNTGDFGSTVFGLGSVNLLNAMRISVRMYNTSPLAKRIINAYTYLTVGEGVNVSWDSKAFRRGGAQKKRDWEKTRKTTRFDAYVKHMIRMTFLGGEAFTVLEKKKPTAVATGMHYLEPDRVPLIYVNSENVDDVKGYEVINIGGQRSFVPRESIIHHRVNRLGNVPRGIPVLLPALRNLREWDLFVENRSWLNRTRARFPASIKVKGGQAQVTAAKASWKGLPQPGTMVVLPEGQELAFPPHNVGASDVADDRRLIAETIAAGVDLPVFVVIPTAGDANYSSSVVAESPMVRMFLEMQELFRPDIERLITELTGDEVGFVVEFPPVLRRGLGELAAALGVGIQNGFMSRQTAWERTRTGDRPWDGPNGELQRIESEQRMAAKANADAMLGFGVFDDGGAPDPNQKKSDGGVGEMPQGTSPGASGRGERATA